MVWVQYGQAAKALLLIRSFVLIRLLTLHRGMQMRRSTAYDEAIGVQVPALRGRATIQGTLT